MLAKSPLYKVDFHNGPNQIVLSILHALRHKGAPKETDKADCVISNAEQPQGKPRICCLKCLLGERRSLSASSPCSLIQLGHTIN